MRTYLDALTFVFHQGRYHAASKGRPYAHWSAFSTSLKFDLEKGLPLLTTNPVDVENAKEEALALVKNRLANYLDVPFSRTYEFNGQPATVVFHREPLFLHERMSILYDQQFTSLEFATKSDKEITALTERLDMSDVTKERLHMLVLSPVNDMAVSVPFDIAVNSIALSVLARHTNCIPGTYTHVMGEYFIRDVEMPLVAQQLQRVPNVPPTIVIKKNDDVDDYTAENIAIIGYNPQERLDFSIAK